MRHCEACLSGSSVGAAIAGMRAGERGLQDAAETLAAASRNMGSRLLEGRPGAPRCAVGSGQ